MGFAPLGPLPGFYPGPAGDLKRSTDPSPTHAPPNHKSWIRPWLLRLYVNRIMDTGLSFLDWGFPIMLFSLSFRISPEFLLLKNIDMYILLSLIAWPWLYWGKCLIPKLTILFFDFFFIQRFYILKIWNLNLYSDRNDIHWMHSFNVYGYRLKSTDIVAVKDITDFKDIRHRTPDDLIHTSSFSHVSILARFLPWCNVLSFRVTIALNSSL